MAKRIMTIDKDKVREIVLWIENTRDLYFGKTIPLLENYTKKYVKGSYDRQKAIKGFQLLLPYGIASYDREFSTRGYRTTMNAREKEEAAKQLFDYYEDIMKEMFKKARKLKK